MTGLCAPLGAPDSSTRGTIPLSTYAPDVAGLPGPTWFATRRSAAVARLASRPLPTPAEEIWRYSRIGDLDLARYGAIAAATTTVSTVSAADLASGVRVVALSEHPDGDALLGSVAPDGNDALTELAVAALVDGIVVDIPAGVVLSEPVRITHRLTTSGAITATRLIVRVGRDAEATVIERVEGDVAVLYLPVVELDVAEAARLRHVGVQALGPDAWQVGYCASSTGRDASLRTMAVALGGDYARLRTDARMHGQGAYNELLAVYFGERTQMHDFRTIQDHAAPKTRSELIFKGAVKDKSASVYGGLIRIAPQGKGSVANQTNRNLILSDDAAAESVPNLEILNNDVKCSHASSVGPIDEDSRYYLESRGVPPEVAERLIVLGFFADLLDRIPDPEMVAQLSAAVAAKFEAGGVR